MNQVHVYVINSILVLRFSVRVVSQISFGER